MGCQVVEVRAKYSTFKNLVPTSLGRSYELATCLRRPLASSSATSTTRATTVGRSGSGSLPAMFAAAALLSFSLKFLAGGSVAVVGVCIVALLALWHGVLKSDSWMATRTLLFFWG